jgi:hypothetical protein
MSSHAYSGEAAVPAASSWEISDSDILDFDAVDTLDVRVVNGTVNVVGTDDPTARLELDVVHGPPLIVTFKNGRLVVAYDDLPWKGFLKWLDRKGWNRKAVVTARVPAGVQLSVGVVGASAVVSGIRGRTEVRGVSGDTTLAGLSGEVRADTVSGAVEAQGLAGPLRFNSVSGGLTVLSAAGAAIKGDSVSGDMIIDVTRWTGRPDVTLNTVSGEVALRLPPDTDTRVEAVTAGGAASSAFDELKVEQWGAARITGTLGSGSGSLRVNTVSGAVALLCRPPVDDDGPEPHAAASLRKDV